MVESLALIALANQFDGLKLLPIASGLFFAADVIDNRGLLRPLGKFLTGVTYPLSALLLLMIALSWELSISPAGPLKRKALSLFGFSVSFSPVEHIEFLTNESKSYLPRD